MLNKVNLIIVTILKYFCSFNHYCSLIPRVPTSEDPSPEKYFNYHRPSVIQAKTELFPNIYILLRSNCYFNYVLDFTLYLVLINYLGSGEVFPVHHL